MSEKCGSGDSGGGAKKLFFGIAVVLIAYVYNARLTKNSEGLIVHTKSGLVRGNTAFSRDGHEFYQWLGIPYAKPPLGHLRFESPLPPDNWTGILDATEYGSVCTQIDMLSGSFMGEESCLFANVYAPKDVSPGELLPTMVFIHGGLFVFGSADRYGPDYLMDERIVMVSFNYRLNSLGFLNTGDGVVRGNMGLKDQVLALRWVQENIRGFSGDPDKVTIFGESAGAVSVHLHLLSPRSKGLFHKAISQSGVALSPWALMRDPRPQAQRFGKMLNCPTDNSWEMIDCMKNLTVFQIVEAHYEVLDPNRDAITLFVPTIESAVQDEETFLPDEPYNILKRGEAHRLPWMTGVVSDEGLIYSAVIMRNETMIQLMNDQFEELADGLLFYKSVPGVGTRIKNFYLPRSAQKSNSSSRAYTMEDFEFGNYSRMFTDRGFNVALHRTVKIQAQLSPVYLYYNNYGGEFSLTHYLLAFKRRFPVILELLTHVITSWIQKNIFGIEPTFYGVCHADDVALLFKQPWISDIRQKDKDYEISKDMVKVWTTFARDEKSLNFRGVPWPPNKSKQQPFKYMKIDGKQPEIIDEPFTDRVNFWLDLNLEGYDT